MTKRVICPRLACSCFLELYLQATVLEVDVKLFTQKKSCLHRIRGRTGFLVNDILVRATSADVVYHLKDPIVASNRELPFTSGNPVYGCLRFLDIFLQVEGGCVVNVAKLRATPCFRLLVFSLEL